MAWNGRFKYCRLCFDCKLQVFPQLVIKESQVKEYAMNITRNHTPSARQTLDLIERSCILALLHVQPSC